jgi:hypothetical protein
MPCDRLARALGSTGLVALLALSALSGCVPGELRLAGGEEAGTDATLDGARDARLEDRGEVTDGPSVRDAGMDALDSAVESGPVDTGSPSLPCGDAACPLTTDVCCVDSLGPSYSCVAATDIMGGHGCPDGGTPLHCTDGADCVGKICCGRLNFEDTGYVDVSCQPTCPQSDSGSLYIIFCDPAAMPDECTGLGKVCVSSKLLPAYDVCEPAAPP